MHHRRPFAAEQLRRPDPLVPALRRLSLFTDSRICHADTSSSVSVSISGQVDTGLLSYSPRLYLTAGMPSLEQRSDAMSSLTGSCPVRPALISILVPSPAMVHRFGRSPPVDASGALRLNLWEEERAVRRVRPSSSSNGLVKKFTVSHSRSDDSGLTQYWSERLSPCERLRSSTADLIPIESSMPRIPSRVGGMALLLHQASMLFA